MTVTRYWIDKVRYVEERESYSKADTEYWLGHVIAGQSKPVLRLTREQARKIIRGGRK